jgi:hypothetical protein
MNGNQAQWERGDEALRKRMERYYETVGSWPLCPQCKVRRIRPNANGECKELCSECCYRLTRRRKARVSTDENISPQTALRGDKERNKRISELAYRARIKGDLWDKICEFSHPPLSYGKLTMPGDVEPQERVMLWCPENPRLHGTEAVIRKIEEWGAVVSAPAAASGIYRAGWDEMVKPPATLGNGDSSAHEDLHSFTPIHRERPNNNLGVPTGDVCLKCGGFMFRSGSCLTCSNCGENTGCS